MRLLLRRDRGHVGPVRKSARQATPQGQASQASLFLAAIQSQVNALQNVKLSDIVDRVSGASQLVQRVLATGPPPTGYPPGPLGERTPAFLRDPLHFLRCCKAAYGPLVTVVLGGQTVVIVADKDAAATVLQNSAPGANFQKEGTAFFPGSSLAGNGLLVSDGEVWQRQRRLANPAFRKAAIDQYASCMVAAAQSMLDSKWAPERGAVREVYTDFEALTLDVGLRALFGESVTAAQGQEVTESIRDAFRHFAMRAELGFAVPEWIPTATNIQYNNAVQRLDTLIYAIICRRRGELASASTAARPTAADTLPAEGHDLLTALLCAREEEEVKESGSTGTGMSDTALRDELMTLMIAAQETNAIALSWTCALLAWNPLVQEAVAREVEETLQGRQPTPEAMQRMPLLQAALLEAMRLHPPAYIVGRCCSAPSAALPCTSCIPGSYTVQRGTTLFVSPYLLHRDSDTWEKPDEYDPWRWIRMRKEGVIGGHWTSVLSGMGPFGAYVPFGAGPRNCIGIGFAMLEALTVLAMVLQRHRLAPPARLAAFPEAAPLLTLRPRGNVPLRLLTRVSRLRGPAQAIESLAQDNAKSVG